MEILGRIVSCEDGAACVAIVRSTACGHSCTSCGACTGREHRINAANPDGYEPGSMVYVEVSDKAPTGLVFAVYMLPLLLVFILGGVAGALFGRRLIAAGVTAGLAIWGVVLFVLNRRAARYRRFDGKIVRRCTE